MTLRQILLDLDRWCNARLGGPNDQTMSQTVGLELLWGTWWAWPVARILDLLTLEYEHCLRSIFTEDWTPMWPERMPRNK